MSSQTLDNISVVELSNRCGVSRKTFYYHYHDIYDLLTQVFLDEKIPNVNSANSYNELIDIIWNYYVQNAAFIEATLASAGRDLFQEFIYNAFYTTTIKFINRIDESKKIQVNIRKAIARFYASGYSVSLVYYLANYKNKTITGLKNCFFFVGNQNLEKIVQKAIKEAENAK